MTTTITKLIAITLLLCFASATTLTLKNKHVFPGETFNVEFKTAGPVDAHDVKLEFAGTTTNVHVPKKAIGMYTTTAQFKAPDLAGEYEIRSNEAVLAVTVENPIVQITNIKVEPESISPRKTAVITYTVENIGEIQAYNVKTKVDLASAQTLFDYDSTQETMFSVMEPGEQTTRTKEITAREKASGIAQVGITVSYEYDQEKHEVIKYASIRVKRIPLLEIAVILLIVLVVAKFVIPKRA